MFANSVATLSESSNGSENILGTGSCNDLFSMTALTCASNYVGSKHLNGHVVKTNLKREVILKKGNKNIVLHMNGRTNVSPTNFKDGKSFLTQQQQEHTCETNYHNYDKPNRRESNKNGINGFIKQKEAKLNRRPIPTNTRRRSIDCTYALSNQSAQSTTVFDLRGKTAIYKQLNGSRFPTNNNKSKSANSIEQDTSFPPLVRQSPYAPPQAKNGPASSKCFNTSRRRTLSGQEDNSSRSRTPSSDLWNDTKSPYCFQTNKYPGRNRRSASVDYTSLKMGNDFKNLICGDTRISLSSGHFSKNATSVAGTGDASSRLLPSNHNSFSSLYNVTSQNDATSSNISDVEENLQRVASRRGSTPNRFKHLEQSPEQHSNGMHTPSSLGSMEKPHEPIQLSSRRYSLPSNMSNRQPLAGSSKSIEFNKTLNEMQQMVGQPSDKKKEAQEETPTSITTIPSSKDLNSIRRDSLHPIEEMCSESIHQANVSAADASTNETNHTPSENTKARNEIHSNLESKLETNKSTNIKFSVDKTSTLEEDTAKSAFNANNPPNKATNGEEAQSARGNPSIFQCIEGDVPKSRAVTSKLETTEQISRNEQNRHFVCQGSRKNNTKETEEFFRAYDCHYDHKDLIDISIIHENDDDLCNEDFHKKRMILWLRDVQVGENAEQTVRDQTPPPSPEPGTHETAIKVVYNGDNKT